MVIHDLEYCENSDRMEQSEQVEGGSFAFLGLSFNSVSIGTFTALQSRIDTINQQGSSATPAIAGFSFVVQSLASSVPFSITP